ncbi:Mitochondrial import inner membrane translocase subunit Tim10 [Irineochytrium annulatum]|nr:Mitochondrial import inner membrane translocase subunit Tim10 [Irineochytrium annulatum]
MDPATFANMPAWQTEILMEIDADFKRRIASNCHTKCIKDYHQDGELKKGESVCIDRCVSKWFLSKAFIEQKANDFSVAYQQK